jgi:hypothetical protein
LFNVGLHRAWEALWESFGQGFDSVEEFKKAIEGVTALDHHFVFFDKHNRQQPYSGNVAPPQLPEFKIRCY